MLDARQTASRRVREETVEAAAREERLARDALDSAAKPSGRDRTPDEQADYDARLARWDAASHRLVAALNDLAAAASNRET
jgi:hypothetical protein